MIQFTFELQGKQYSAIAREQLHHEHGQYLVTPDDETLLSLYGPRYITLSATEHHDEEYMRAIATGLTLGLLNE